MRFKEKVVLITGGSSAIGTTTAVSYAKEGASVAIVDLSEEKLREVAQRCEKLGAATLIIKADVSNDEEANLIVKQTIDRFGKLDILVNHAGVNKEAGILSDHFLTTYDEVMNVNMRGAIRLTYFAVPHLIKTKGNIVNVSNMSGMSTTKILNIAYRISKAAMIDFTKRVALELTLQGVRVNMISPGPDRNAMFNTLKVNIGTTETSPQRLSDPNEIADMILYISSDRGRNITGSNFWFKLWTSDNKKNIEVRNSLIDQISSLKSHTDI